MSVVPSAVPAMLTHENIHTKLVVRSSSRRMCAIRALSEPLTQRLLPFCADAKRRGFLQNNSGWHHSEPFTASATVSKCRVQSKGAACLNVLATLHASLCCTT